MDDNQIRVLLVEDDAVDQMAFKRMVKEEQLPYEYDMASSVAQARAVLASQKFDVVLLDYMLADGNAFDVMDLVQGTPIIITTGSGDEKVAVKAMKAGAYDYLIKDPSRHYLTVLPITIEHALRRSKAEKQFSMLSHALMSIEDSVYITDMDDKVIFVNKAFCRTYGYAEQEILGKPSGILWQEDPGESIAKGQPGQRCHRRKDGSEFPVSHAISTIKDDQGLELARVGVMRDLTERLHAEETRLMALFTELDPAPVFRFDEAGTVVMANQAATEILGRESVVGMSLKKVVPGLENVDFSRSITESSIQTCSANIRERFFDFIVKGVPDLKMGHVYGTDLTERKRLEEELLKQERLATVGQTIAGLAHCMKNIFTAVNGGLQLLEHALSTNDREVQQTSLGVLRRSSTRLYMLVMNMLDYSKKRELNKEAVKITDSFAEVRLMLDSEAKRKNALVEYTVESGAETYQFDPQLLFRSLLNLGVNAMEAIPDGGRLGFCASVKGVEELGLSSEQLASRNADQTSKFYVIEVNDNGVGIPQDKLPHIFEPLFSTKGTKGTGLGLAIVRQFVEEHEGIIQVDSTLGKGTRFRLLFLETAESPARKL